MNSAGSSPNGVDSLERAVCEGMHFVAMMFRLMGVEEHHVNSLERAGMCASVVRGNKVQAANCRTKRQKMKEKREKGYGA